MKYYQISVNNTVFSTGNTFFEAENIKNTLKMENITVEIIEYDEKHDIFSENGGYFVKKAA